MDREGVWYMMKRQRKRLALVLAIGTRPEAIKLGPIVAALRKRPDVFETTVLLTGQHRELVADILPLFEIEPDIDLDLMRPGQELPDLTARVVTAMSSALKQLHPDMLIVQGDTTSVFGAALAAFYRRVPVAHVEAGLRTGDLSRPYPEEANRRLTGVLSHLHFAPTPRAKENLLREGVDAERILVTGNTVVDAIAALMERPFSIAESPLSAVPFEKGRLVLVTAHRRESWGDGLRNICASILELCQRFSDLRFVLPVHPNPNVVSTVQELLAGRDRIHLLAPLDYLSFLNLMRRCDLILSDSGGVQEEAPSFGKQVLLLREVTERPEAFELGYSRIVGTDPRRIVEESSRILTDQATPPQGVGYNPYGDGRATKRIVQALLRYFHGAKPLLDSAEEFHSTARPGETAWAGKT